MDTPHMFASATAALATFSDATRLYALEGGGPLGQLQVERWSGSEALSACYVWTIDALSTDAGLSLDAMLGQRCALRTTLADGGRIRRSGLVREAQLLGADGGLARYRLVLVPWLWLLSQGRHSRVFQDQDVLAIAEGVFADYAPYAAWKVAPDARALLADVRPRSYAVQYRETDLAFIERLLAEEGLGYAFVEDAEVGAGHALVIFADSGQLPEDASSAADPFGRGIRFHRVAAVEASDTLQALGPARALAPDAVTWLSHDYKSLAATAASVALDGAQGRREAYDPVGPYAFADSREAQHYAQLAAQAHEARQQRWEGRGTVRTARAGTRFHVAQAPWESASAAMPEGFVWTALSHAGVNNLPGALKHAAQVQLGAADESVAEAHHAVAPALWTRAEANGYAQHFDAVDQARPWRPALTDGHGTRLNPRPTAPGVQTAIVVGAQGETSPGAGGPLHTDALGRLKVKFHWMQGGASCWLRSTQRYAGNGHGAQFLPRIGQEVLVNFMDGDIDRPVIVGALYNGQGEAGIAPSPGQGESAPDGAAYAQAADFAPSAQGNLAGGHSPAWHGQSADAAGHANAAALSGVKTQGFDGHGYNQLVFDDTDGQGRVQFGTTQSATQLNLGHLIHQADNYRGSFRGTGLELRTDGYGAVRGSKGVLLTTYSASPGEPAADATAVGALLGQHAQLAEALSQAAATHQAVPLAGHEGVKAASQSQLDAQAAPLGALRQSAVDTVSSDDFGAAAPDRGAAAVPHSADALTTLAARGGLGAVAGQSLHMAAGETLNLGSGQHGNLAVAGQLRMHAGQAIGLLAGAQKADGVGLNLVAGKGALEVQAQHDTLALRSKGDLRLISANAAVELAAKQAVHLANSQGAFLTIEGGNLTFGCPGKLTVHAGNHKLEGATQLSREMNQWSEPKFDQRVKLVTRSGKPAPNQRYEIHRDDGAIIKGVTDGEGWTQLQKGMSLDGISVKWLGKA
ncbi:type VI secretion system Vgr family protein [Fulvimonas sp. R45]|uniref:type VI secretion system Vgr family protein n=1 Tax=Fulvimonas sp. R45 TaxID=3045937 RepID=UPI00265FC919|nr:type VI secretion system Vgr family protein [Fulvimonas sp. R45]MDO1530445.1 type VI secretion system Vgr family protein [Fulvimonas sp. R45]